MARLGVTAAPAALVAPSVKLASVFQQEAQVVMVVMAVRVLMAPSPSLARLVAKVVPVALVVLAATTVTV